MTRQNITAFERLFDSINDSKALYEKYDSIIKDLCKNESFWNNGPIGLQRILWTEGEKARTDEDTKIIFNSAGLYLWGIKDRPLYIGITRNSFRKRFYRYIWSKRSQCNLAKEHESSLLESKNFDGFPPDITDWCNKTLRGNSVRLKGAVRFANEGISGIWFALLPHTNLEEIGQLEKALIPVAEKWNRNHPDKPNPLLNREYNSKKKVK